MSQEKYFHFTIGPVQGFVAQARRTRDFWAGSFLLSWLSGVAMAEIIRQGGEIKFPVPPDGYLDWIEGKGKSEKPRQGAIPNRFKATEAKVPAGFDGKKVKQCVQEAWFALAEHIWKEDCLSKISTASTRAIWERQNKNFWDISWVLTKDDTDTSLMDQRKNWRSHYAESGEPGVKCMVMDGWQELSGAERPGKEGNSFWKEIREDAKRTGIKTDLGEKEQLCALAYVKRRFARYFGSFNDKKLESGLTVNGWKLETGMPSVSYMAAVHWLEKLIQTANFEEVKPLLEAARNVVNNSNNVVNNSKDEWDTQIVCLKTAAGSWTSDNDKRRLLALDGNLFFDHVQDNATAYGYDKEKIKLLKNEITQFKKKHPEFTAPLSPFYAILLMDGDSLGSKMSKKENQPVISHALNAFTAKTPEIVKEHNGMLIYAGGDDVLAILPLEDALKCATAVRQCYLDSFSAQKTNTGIDIPTTISAAIEFAHVKMPLGKILSDAHDLLNNIAKKGAGRDALAVRVWKQGGMALEWAQPWEIALTDDGKRTHIEKIAKDFEDQDKKDGGENNHRMSNKFFFKIREHFYLLNPDKEEILNQEKAVEKSIREANSYLNEKEINEAIKKAIKEAIDKFINEAIELLAVDYVNSEYNREKISMVNARIIIKPLLIQCCKVTRSLDEPDPDKWKRSSRLEDDGALLVRFLVQKGVER